MLNVLKANQNNVEILLENLLEIIDALLDRHSPKKPKANYQNRTKN